jgi:mono/diheme cytochrome c family protein
VTQRLLWGGAALLVIVGGEVGCQSPTHPASTRHPPTLSPSARPANTVGLSNEEVGQGPKLFAAKCARCHPLYDPAAYTDAEWDRWMSKMSKKAHLKTDQQEILSRYLGAFRTSP